MKRTLRWMTAVGLAAALANSACNCNPQPEPEEDAGPSQTTSSSSSGVASGSSSSAATSSSTSTGGTSSGVSASGGTSGTVSSTSADSSGASGSSGLGSSGIASSGIASSGAATSATSGTASSSESASGTTSGAGSSSGVVASSTSSASTSSSSSSTGGSSSSSSSTGGSSSAAPAVLSVVRISPTAAYRGEDTAVVLYGTLFQDGATVRFEHRVDASQPGGTFELPGAMGGNGTSLAVVLLADQARPEGLYQVTVLQGADSAVAPDSFRVTIAPPPSITGVTPTFAYKGDPNDGVLSDRVLTLTGTGFLTGASVEFIAADVAGNLTFEATETAVNSPTSISATLPSESQRMPLGRYFVSVVNPDGQTGFWLVSGRREMVEIRDVAPPRVASLNPARPAQTSSLAMTIGGTDFGTGAVVNLIAFDGTVCPATTPTSVSATEIQVTLTSGAGPCTFSNSSFFIVRVTNTDGQYGEYSSLHFYSNEGGKLGSFTLAGTNNLVYARQRHDSTVFFDDTCSPSIVLAGGEGRLAGSTASVAPILEVERAVVTPFGQLGPFSVLQTAADDGRRVVNSLRQARLGAQVHSLGDWVYVIGGMDAAGAATNSVERATVLTSSTAVGTAFVDGAGAGQLPEGRFHYKVAAVLPSTAARYSGEGLASRAISERADVSGALGVVFEAYPGATGYRIYRSPGPNGGAGSVRLIAFGVAGTPVANRPGLLRYVDTGEGLAGSAPGDIDVLPQTGGTLPAGYYGYRISALRDFLGTPAESPAGIVSLGQTSTGNLTLRLTWDAVPGAVAYRVYRTSSSGLTGSPVDASRTASFLAEVTAPTTEYADTGATALGNTAAPDGEAPLPRGALSRFEVDTASVMGTARQGHEVLSIPLGSEFNQVHVYAVGGRAGRTGATLKSTEHATLTAGGSLSWTPATFNSSPVDLTLARAHYSLATNAGSREGLTCASSAAPPDPCQNADLDGDGFRSIECGGTDCDDTNRDVNVNAPEQCTNTIDDDCDTLIDGLDPDCALPDAGVPDAGRDAGPPLNCADPAVSNQDGDEFRRMECGGTDCNDNDPNINPGIYESPSAAAGLCGNGIDEDCWEGDAVCTVAAALPPGQWAMTGNEEVYLLAAAGTQGLTGQTENIIAATSGTTGDYAEVAFVRPDGQIEQWLPVSRPSSFAGRGFGVESLMYFGFLYVFAGSNQTSGQMIDRIGSNAPMGSGAWDSVTMLDPQNSTAGGLTNGRIFFSRERIFSTVFVLGGQQLTGNVTSVPTCGGTGHGCPLAGYEYAPE